MPESLCEDNRDRKLEGRGVGQNIRRCETPCCCYLYTFCTCSHSRLIESAGAGVSTGSYIMNGGEVALFWTWMGTKCVSVHVCARVCVWIEGLRALSQLLSTHEGQTHTCTDTASVAWCRSKDRGASCKRGKPGEVGPVISAGWTAEESGEDDTDWQSLYLQWLVGPIDWLGECDTDVLFFCCSIYIFNMFSIALLSLMSLNVRWYFQDSKH